MTTSHTENHFSSTTSPPPPSPPLSTFLSHVVAPPQLPLFLLFLMYTHVSIQSIHTLLGQSLTFSFKFTLAAFMLSSSLFSRCPSLFSPTCIPLFHVLLDMQLFAPSSHVNIQTSHTGGTRTFQSKGAVFHRNNCIGREDSTVC